MHLGFQLKQLKNSELINKYQLLKNLNTELHCEAYNHKDTLPINIEQNH